MSFSKRYSFFYANGYAVESQNLNNHYDFLSLLESGEMSDVLLSFRENGSNKLKLHTQILDHALPGFLSFFKDGVVDVQFALQTASQERFLLHWIYCGPKLTNPLSLEEMKDICYLYVSVISINNPLI